MQAQLRMPFHYKPPFALAAACLSIACVPRHPPPLHGGSSADSSDGYVVLVPDVSVSPAEPRDKEQAAQINAHEDVMAEILAIPPGR